MWATSSTTAFSGTAQVCPLTSGKAFDYVIGQTSFTNLSGWSTPNANNYLPSAMVGNHNYLVQVDGHDNRVLLINGFPRATVNANVVVGQATFVGNANACTQAGLSAPRGASLTSSNRLLVADTANNRVLVWLTLPTTNGQSADLVLGQPTFTMCTQPGNNGSGAGTLSQPQDVWSDGTHVLVADTYAYRVLIWNTFPTVAGQHADAVLGQTDFVSNGAIAGPLGVGGPAGVTSDGNSIFVAEYGYSRATQWSGVPWTGATPALTAVLGEVDEMTTTCNQGSATPTAQFTLSGFRHCDCRDAARRNRHGQQPLAGVSEPVGRGARGPTRAIPPLVTKWRGQSAISP